MKSTKTIGHGFFRKTKLGLASGIVLGASTVTGQVFADEVSQFSEIVTTNNPATNLVGAQEDAPQANVDMAANAGVQTGTLTSEIVSQDLNNAVSSANNAGVEVSTGGAMTYGSLEEANTDLAKQITEVEAARAEKEANTVAIKDATEQNAKIDAENKAEAERVAKKNAADKAEFDAREKAKQDAYNSANNQYNELNGLAQSVNQAVDQAKGSDQAVTVTEKAINYGNVAAAKTELENIRNQNTKLITDYKAEKERIDKANADTRAREAAFAETKLAEGNNGVVISGKFNTNATGKDFYRDVTVVYTGNDKSVKTVKDLGWGSGTTITDVNGMTMTPYAAGTPNGVGITSQVSGQYVMNNVSVGDSFKMNNIGTLADGSKLHAQVTVTKVEKDNGDNSYFVIGYQDFGDAYDPIAVDYYNFSRIGLNFKFVDDSGREVKVLQGFVVGDVDFAQGSDVKFKDNSLNRVNPPGSELVESKYGLQTSHVFQSDSLSSAPLGTYLAAGMSSEIEYIHTTDIDPNTQQPETNNKNYFIEFLLFGTAAKVNTQTFTYEEPPKVSLTKVSIPEQPAQPTPDKFIPVDPVVKPHVKVPEVKNVKTQVHPVFVKHTPSNLKTVVDEDGTSVDGMLVPKGSIQTWELKNDMLRAGRDEVTSYVMNDPAPAGFKVDMDATKAKNNGVWDVSINESGELTFVATKATLDGLNKDRKANVALPVAYFVGATQNDGGTYKNTFTTVVRTPKGEYKVVSNTPVIYTPGNNPENPREDPNGEDPTPDDNLIQPKKDVIDKETGKSINGQSVLPNSVLNYVLTQDFDQYKGMSASKNAIGKGFLYVEDYLDAALDGKSMEVESIKAANGDDVAELLQMYHVLSMDTLDEKLQTIVKESGISPVGEFYMWVAKNPEEFFKAYVQKGLDITYNLSFKIKDTFKEGDITNGTYQIDFGNGYYSNIVVNNLPKMEVHKDVLDKEDGVSINNGEVALGQEATYRLEGWVVPANRGYDLYEYKFVDQLQHTHDMFLRDKVVAKVDIKLSDGSVIEKGSDLSKYTEVKYNEETGLYELAFKEDFLKQIPRDSEFGADVFLVVKRIAVGEVKNEYTLYVNGNPVKSEIVVTRTPEPPMPEKPENPTPVVRKPETPKPALPNTGSETSAMGTLGLLMVGFAGASMAARRKKN